MFISYNSDMVMKSVNIFLSIIFSFYIRPVMCSCAPTMNQCETIRFYKNKEVVKGTNRDIANDSGMYLLL